MYGTYPIYIPSARYARENGEIELWRESYKINKECKDFINENASRAYHEDNLHGFVKAITDMFGLERTMYVIGRTVVFSDWDKRYDSKTRERAAQFDYQDMKEAKALYEAGQDPYRTADNTRDYSSNVHPCILNAIFHKLINMEQEQVNIPSADIENENELDEGAEI